MAPKRRGRAPPPPAPPPQESGSDDAEEELPRVPAAPQNPPPPSPANAAHGDDGHSSSEDEGPAPKKKAAAARKSKADEARKRSAAPEPAPSGQAKRAKSEARKPSPFRWSKEDAIKILQALSAHMKSHGVLLKTDELIALVGDDLDRKTFTYRDMYVKVRYLKKCYEKAVETGTPPSTQEDLRIYNLSEAVWGDKAKEAIAAATSHDDSAMETKRKSKKQESHNEALGAAAKGGMSKETTTSTTETGGAFTQNHGSPKSKEWETHDAEIATEGAPKSRDFTELQNLYPNLSVLVEGIEAQHPCGKILKRAFEFIDDEKARDLESEIQVHRLAEAKAQNRREVITEHVRDLLIGLMAGED